MVGNVSVYLCALITGLCLSIASASQHAGTSIGFKETAHIECPSTAITPQQYVQWPTVQVHQVRWNPKRDLLAIWCTNTPDIYIFDSSNYRLKYTLVDPNPYIDEGISELSWSPDGAFLIKVTQQDIDIWKFAESSVDYVRHIAHLSQNPSIAWKPDSRYLADVDGTDVNNQRVVNIYEIPSGKIVKTLDGESQATQYVLWSRDGKKLIATTYNDKLQIWDASTYTILNTISIHPGGILVQGEGDNIVGSYCSGDNTCILWTLNLESLQLREPFEATIPDRYFFEYKAYQTSPDGHLFACSGGLKTVYIFDTSSGKIDDQIDLAADYVTSVSWSLDSTKLVTGDTDGIARIWTNQENKF